MIKWFTAELHAHTLHSDGSLTVEELLNELKNDNTECIAITDHNTYSGHDEINEALQEKYMPVIHGIEWTTFFGHMVVLQCKKFVDWRFATPNNIDEKIIEIHENNGIVGIAHPFVLGSPFCTGCHWDFIINDWNLPDYIEIWSEKNPSENILNKQAYYFWLSKLDEGFKIAISHGKDIHSKMNPDNIYGFTLLGIEQDKITADLACQAIRSGRTIVSVGPFVDVIVTQNDTTYTIGDTLKKGNILLDISVSLDTIKKQTNDFWEIEVLSAKIISQNLKTLEDITLSSGKGQLQMEISNSYFIVQIEGKLKGNDTILAITSPIYFC